jgi:hypothetical protein
MMFTEGEDYGRDNCSLTISCERKPRMISGPYFFAGVPERNSKSFISESYAKLGV